MRSLLSSRLPFAAIAVSLLTTTFVTAQPLPSDIPHQEKTTVIQSTTHPIEGAWFSSRHVSVSWTVPADAIAVSTLYDDRPDSIPKKVYAPPITEKSFTAEKDGVSYFHLQFKTDDGWKEVVHFRLQIDTQPPTGVSVRFPGTSTTTSPSPMIFVTATDATSDIGDIQISVDGKTPITHMPDFSNLYRLPQEKPGKHSVTVTVRDRAGNAAYASHEYEILAIDPPKIREYTRNAELGEALKISGTTYPSSTVEIVYTNIRTNEEIAATAQSGANGYFTHVEREGIPAAMYEMKVRVTDSQGAESEPAGPFIVNVEGSVIATIGTLLVNWLSLVLLIIISVTLAAATLWYSLLQFARFRRKVRRTMQEAEQVLKMSVGALRRDTEEFYTVLKKAEKKRELTKEEQSILRKFKKRLDSTEKEIEKKLERIG